MTSRTINENEQRLSRREARAETRRARHIARIQDMERQMSELEERLRIIENENELNLLEEELGLARNKVNTARERFTRLDKSVKLQTTRLTREQMASNAGLEYHRARSVYDDYRNANPDDREGLIRRHDEYNNIYRAMNAISQERIRPLIIERDMAKRGFDEAKGIYDNLFERRKNLVQEISDLHQRINKLRHELTQAQGKRRHIDTYKKNKHGGSWSLKYKRSINCKRPRGFSQKQYCKYKKNS